MDLRHGRSRQLLLPGNGQADRTVPQGQSMTQTQLADALGIAQQTMAHYEGGG